MRDILQHGVVLGASPEGILKRGRGFRLLVPANIMGLTTGPEGKDLEHFQINDGSGSAVPAVS